MTCRYDSTDLRRADLAFTPVLDIERLPVHLREMYELAPGRDAVPLRCSRKTRCIVKRTRNGARIKLFHSIDVYEPVEQDKVVDEVPTKRRYCSTGPAFCVDFRDFNVSEMLRSRGLVRSLDKMLSLSLTNGLASGDQRRDRAAGGTEDCADRGRERGDGCRVHMDRKIRLKKRIDRILTRSSIRSFSKLSRRGRA